MDERVRSYVGEGDRGTRSDKECSIRRERGGYDHAGRCDDGGMVCVWAVEWTINEEGREEED